MIDEVTRSNFPLQVLLEKGFAQADIFIETGIGDGSTLNYIFGSGSYKQIHSIEISAQSATPMIERYKDEENVSVHIGTSPMLLKEILESIQDKQILFWLDAHFTPCERVDFHFDSEYGECPVLFELRAIKEANLKIKPVILIDDSRFYKEDFWDKPESHLFKKSDWPRIEEIKAEFSDYKIADFDGVLYCVPYERFKI